MASTITAAEKASATRDELKREKELAKAGKPVDAPRKQNMDEHMMTAEEIATRYETDLINGLKSAQVPGLIEKFGSNTLTPPKTRSAFMLFIDNMTGFFSLLLWGAALLCFIGYALDKEQPENLYLGIVLVVVVFLTGVFSFFQEYKSAAVMESFKSLLPPKSLVMRDGKQIEVDAAGLVPGDIVVVKNGSKIPADIRIISCSNFKVDNSSLTGESEPQKRKIENNEELFTEATNIAFYGTLAVEGECVGIVCKTGDTTFMGSIAKLTTSTDTEQTPIAKEIAHFIHIVSAVAVFLGVTFLIIGFAKGTAPVANLVFAIGIIVANVPEGLLATVTVALTLTAKQMATKKVLVKNLEAVETLGSTTCIASDKTGTLTQNRMTVRHVYYDQQTKLGFGDSADSKDSNSPSFDILARCATLSSKAEFESSEENLAKDIFDRQCTGDASENGFIQFCETVFPGGIAGIRNANKCIARVPFNSTNKYSASIHLKENKWESPRQLFMKGAPERIVARCDKIMVNGEPVPMTEEHKANFDANINRMMQGGERVLGCCYCELDPSKYPDDYEYEISDPTAYNWPNQKGDGLIFIGLISLIDPPRTAVPKAVLNCQTAGIKVVMVTGDHPETAEAIAKQVNIIKGKTRRDVANARGVAIKDVAVDDDEVQAIVITGGELLSMDDEEISGYLDYDQIVFARTSPEQKLIIVKNLQNKTHIHRGYPADNPLPVRHVVAVTGDGVNDSPALRKADIGVAMGIAGSDVAKGAADMILLNDNFASIVDGIEEGRLIFDNLKKSIAYTLSSNIPEISPFLVYIIAAVPLPLPTVLILCIDLGTDMIPAISLAYENKEADIMLKPPRNSITDRLVTGRLINFAYLQVGVVQAVAGFTAYVTVLNDYGFPPWILPALDTVWRAFHLHDYPKTISGAEFGQTYMCGLGSAHAVNTVAGRMGLTLTNYLNSTCSTGSPRMEYFAPSAAQTFLPTVYPGGVPSEIIALHPTCNLYEASYNTMNDCFNPKNALPYAQCAFFISIIVVQWSDLMACKTRSLSITTQGMKNGWMNFGLVFETCLGMLLCYGGDDLNMGLGTRPIEFIHWLPAMPFMIFILSYDEVRKYLMRTLGKNNWFYRNTYY